MVMREKREYGWGSESWGGREWVGGANVKVNQNLEFIVKRGDMGLVGALCQVSRYVYQKVPMFWLYYPCAIII